ncbi:uroporphyrinogen-III synthase [Salsuginibacillus kocurii]|uniref:uroporphyrinogen-III synthase n=1 Tax=Salsuginibacillus kocurii TaxID=427078 RepID=UPI0003708512|nr:uroporphyrinogen-III synthase [Salsuginibacillus kocurii]
MADPLKARGAEPLPLPLFRLQPREPWRETVRDFVRALQHAEWLVFTSANAVEYVIKACNLTGTAIENINVNVAVVGEKTAQKAEQHGFQVELAPTSYNAEALAAKMIQHISPEETIVLPQSAQARPVLRDELQKAGFNVLPICLYNNVMASENESRLKESLTLDEIDVITFLSPSAVNAFCGIAGKDMLEQARSLTVFCIGPITEEAALQAGFQDVHTSEQSTIEGLVLSLEEWYRKGGRQ